MAAARGRQALVHFPHRNGPVCGARPVPTDARDYAVDADKITCEKCQAYVSRVEQFGQRADVDEAPYTGPAPTAGPRSTGGKSLGKGQG